MNNIHLKSPKGWINDPNCFIYYRRNASVSTIFAGRETSEWKKAYGYSEVRENRRH